MRWLPLALVVVLVAACSSGPTTEAPLRRLGTCTQAPFNGKAPAGFGPTWDCPDNEWQPSCQAGVKAGDSCQVQQTVDTTNPAAVQDYTPGCLACSGALGVLWTCNANHVWQADGTYACDAQASTSSGEAVSTTTVAITVDASTSSGACYSRCASACLGDATCVMVCEANCAR